MKLWELTGPAPICVLDVHDATAINFSPDDRLFEHSATRMPRSLSTSGSRAERQNVLKAASAINSLAFNPSADKWL